MIQILVFKKGVIEMKFKLIALLSLLFVALASSASAWGPTGHRVVCEIAFKELNDEARREVIRLIRMDNEFRYFYDSCNWPDNPRQRGGEHYVNLHRKATAIKEGNECGPAGKCVITAILKDLSDVALSATDNGKLQSLKFLGHWMGDIHQPLHVSFSDDRGGNNIKENGSCTGSLHRVWDSCILEKALGTDPVQIADDLRAEITNADRAAWTMGIENTDVKLVSSWANESFAATTHPDVEYCVKRDGGCFYSDTIDWLGSHDPEKAVKVDDDYVARNSETVATRLKMAGVRLGALLNVALGDG